MVSTKTILLAVLLVAPLGLASARCGEEPVREPGAQGTGSDARASEEFDTAGLDSLPGASGILDLESGNYRLSVPRDDLVVTVDGARLATRTALEGWVAFKPVPGGVVLTAELPMLVDEVNPVISAALLHNLRVTALDSHFSREEPRVWYLHLSGIGETDSLAAAVGAVLQTLDDVKGQPREAQPQLDTGFTTPDPVPLDSILGLRGRMQQGAYEITVPRSTRLEGYDLGRSSGIATRIAIAGSDARAMVSGNLALIESELQPVLKALRASGIEITSIDDPLLAGEPRIIFLHFWGRGRAVDLARAIRDALDATSQASD